MPRVEFVDPEQLPQATRVYGRQAVLAAMDVLRQALKTNRALVLRLAEHERFSAVRNAYRTAARELGIELALANGEVRTYRGKGGTERREPGSLAIRIVGSVPKPPRPAAAPNGLHLEPPPEMVSRPLPGLEVRR